MTPHARTTARALSALVAIGVLVPASLMAPTATAASLPAVAPAAPSADTWTGPKPTSTRMSASDRADLKALVDTEVAGAGGQIPGAWVGVWDPKKGWAVVSTGNAVVGGAAAINTDHSRIGSATKTFVATQILRLIDRGRLRLSDTIGDLLPAVAKAHPYVKDVTVKQMLGMRSGIADYTEVPGMIKEAYENPDRDWTARQLIEVGLDSADGLGLPNYSNTNYLLLGEIARKVTGRSIFSLVNADVRRLGLKQTRLPVPGQSAIPAPASKGYTYDAGLFSFSGSGLDIASGDEQQDDVTQWGQAAGSMYSTVADLGRWAATGLGLAELSPALAAKRQAFRPINGGFIRYGLGMESFGGDWVGHDGQAIGWESRVAYNTKTGAVGVVLVNETGSLQILLPVLRAYFPDMER
jgi:D-alanyl-D-alanine carboxypeptidase